MKHGQSPYTPTKQKHLNGLLSMFESAWNPTINDKQTWAHRDVICIDCTSGSGHADTGEIGSPLIINQWAIGAYGYDFQQLCCERTPQSYVKLTDNSLPQTTLKLGDYRDEVQAWLRQLDISLPKRALGFVYCDPNGVKDLLDGLSFFQWVASEPRYERLDFIFHWSLTAYQRNFGASTAWANDQLIDIINALLGLKRFAIIREPMGNPRWVIMYLHNSGKVDGRWRKEGFLPADEWMDKYLRAKGQQLLLNDDVMAEMSI